MPVRIHGDGEIDGLTTFETTNVSNPSNTGNPNIVLGSDGDTQVQSLTGGPLAGLRNVLINGGFNFQQRSPGAGITVTDGASEYYSDRWLMIPVGTDITTGLSTGAGRVYQTITPTTTGTGVYCYFVQAWEIMVLTHNTL